MSLQVDAILFDMDGTLVDERASYREAIRLTAQFLLADPVSEEEVEAVKRLPGFNNDWDATWAVVENHLSGRPASPDAADRASSGYRRLQSVFQTYYLGHALWHRLSGENPPIRWIEPLILRETPLVSPQALARLGDYRLGIATSRPRVEALMALQQHGLGEFFPDHAVVAMEDADREKPHPAPLLEVQRRLQCVQPVYVGDTINDALAAREAGMPFIHIGTEPFAETALESVVAARVRGVADIVDICTPSIDRTNPA
ncbi:MAG TPA: HAD family hydrolase [Chloroflexota bacterium]